MPIGIFFQQMRDKGVEPPQELNTDLESAFKSKEFQKLLEDNGVTWRPKKGTRREDLSHTARLDSTIGRWRNALLDARREGDEVKDDWWNYTDQATRNVNGQELAPLRRATPEHAVDEKEAPLLAFTQPEKVF